VIYVGIDPGLHGGLAAVNDDGHVLAVHAFKPTDGEFSAHELSDLLTDIRTMEASSLSLMAGVERVHAMPKQGVSSCFKFGKVYGQILGVLSAKLIPYELVTPNEWMATMLKGENREDGKNRAKVVAQRLFPELNLRATERSTTVHSGMADALLIAEFIRRKHKGTK
jgi:hypothetical protein